MINVVVWGTQLDFRFIGEEKGYSTMCHQSSPRQVQQHQCSQTHVHHTERSSMGTMGTTATSSLLPADPGHLQNIKVGRRVIVTAADVQM